MRAKGSLLLICAGAGHYARTSRRRQGKPRMRWLDSIKEATGLCSGVLTLNLPTTTIVAQPFNVIKWQLKFNPVA